MSTRMIAFGTVCRPVFSDASSAASRISSSTVLSGDVDSVGVRDGAGSLPHAANKASANSQPGKHRALMA